MFKKAILVSICLFSTLLVAQDPATGVPPFGSFENGKFDVVNRANMNVNVSFPVVSVRGRGINFSFGVINDSAIWQLGAPFNWTPAQLDLNGNPTWGWKTDQVLGSAVWTFTTSTTKCFDDAGGWFWGTRWIWSGYRYRDGRGTTHAFGVSYQIMCGNASGATTATAADGSGYYIDATSTVGTAGIHGYPVIYGPDGTKLTGDLTNGFTRATDTNGNYISKTVQNSTTTDWTDSVGRTALEIVKSGSDVQYKTVDATGTPQTATLYQSSFNIKTHFGCLNGITEYTGTATLPTSYSLPGGLTYSITYEPTPGSPGYTTGRIQQITLPLGGYYEYIYNGAQDGQHCGTGNVVNMTRRINDGTTSSDWVFASTGTITTELDPNGNNATYDYTSGPLQQVKIYAGAVNTTNLKQTVDITNSGIYPTSFTTTMDNSEKSKVVVAFDLYGNVTEKDEYAWGSGVVGALLRKTTVSYLNTSAYTAKNIRNRVSEILVKDANSPANTISDTQMVYDGTALAPVSSVVQHDPSYDSITTRGNPTQTKMWVSGTNYLVSNTAYDTTGQITSVTDTNGNQTSFSYADVFFKDDAVPAPSSFTAPNTTNAYPTTVTLPMSSVGTTSRGYYYYTGQVASITDPNGATSYSHFADPLHRPTRSYGPQVNSQRPWSLVSYASATQVDSYTSVDDTSASTGCTSCVHNQSALDGLGRAVHSYLVNDPDGQTAVDLTFDPIGRLASIKNPYRSTTEATYGTTSFQYDVLNRSTGKINQDSSTPAIYYSSDVTAGTHGGIGTQLCAAATYGLGYPTLAKDEAGKKRESWTDALGRLIEIDEPDASNNLTLNTCYKYDLNDNLTDITQDTRVRDFAYDGLSRLLTATTPENGAAGSKYVVNYYYTQSDNVTKCSGNASAICRKKDTGRNITTSYTYDAMNRLTQKSYDDGTTATVHYYYDQASYNGLNPITNGKGRRTGITDDSSSPTTAAWSYDPAGNVLTEQRTIAGVTKHIDYTYNLSNLLKTITYPKTNSTDANQTVTYAYTNIGRPASAIDSGNSINYAKNATYFPNGALKYVLLGNSGTFGGIALNYAYNNRLQRTSIDAGANIFQLSFDYGASASNNGQVLAENNLRFTTRSFSLQYDTFGRVIQANTSGTSTLWGNDYVYDRWTNLYQKNLHPGFSNYENLSLTTNTNNQLTGTGIAYDNTGERTDSPQNYTWNGEGLLTQANTTTYKYDADDIRVQKSSGKLYWRGSALATSDLSGTMQNFYVVFSGLPIARRTSGGTVNYNFYDQIGSTRVVTDDQGSPCYDTDYYPYGVEQTASPSSCPPEFKFAGYERDTEPGAGLDYAVNRYYSPGWGRFMSPDPLSGDAENPQSLNRYAYVAGDPINATDPLGLRMCVSDPCDRYGYGGLSSFFVESNGFFYTVGTWDSIVGLVGSLGGPFGDWGAYGDGFGISGYGGGLFGENLGLPNGISVQQLTLLDALKDWLGIPETNCMGDFVSCGTGNGLKPLKSTWKDDPCKGVSSGSSIVEGLDAAGTAAISFNLAAVHIGVGGALVSAGCLDPTPFEPVTCAGGLFGAGATFGGAAVLGRLGTLETHRAIADIKQAIKCW